MRVYTHSKVLLELLGEAFMQMGRYVGKAQGVGGGKGYSRKQTLEKLKRRVWHIGRGGSVHCARYEGALLIGF